MTSTDSAKEFLERLEEHLGQALPAWPEIATAVGLSSDDGEIPAETKRIAFPEVAFLQQFIVKNIYGISGWPSGTVTVRRQKGFDGRGR